MFQQQQELALLSSCAMKTFHILILERRIKKNMKWLFYIHGHPAMK